MSPRLIKFESFSKHPMHKGLFKKLSGAELDRCRKFIFDNESLNHNEFAAKANRWMLDQERPKNYSTMWALVFQSNGKGSI